MLNQYTVSIITAGVLLDHTVASVWLLMSRYAAAAAASHGGLEHSSSGQW